MTHEEAVQESRRRSAEEPTALWTPREREPGEWIVVRARVEGLPPRGKLKPGAKPPPVRPGPEEFVGPQPHWLPWAGA